VNLQNSQQAPNALGALPTNTQQTSVSLVVQYHYNFK
jgi:hypothetical protein